MHTIKLKVHDDIYNHIIFLLNSLDKKKIEIITQAFTDAKYVHGFTSVVSSIGCKCIVGYEIDFVNVCIEKRETDRISRGIGNLCMCRLK